ncbi:MAG: helix-turn-helix transcriptional regulator [Treponema sp.]|nr:helix-turn-helix transcriptional regulator [Treponema sp.]
MLLRCYYNSVKYLRIEFAKDFDTGYEEFKIGMMIKKMRLESGITQEQLAEKLETKKSVISRMENHSEDIRLSPLQKVASVFGKQLRVAML